ncbi:translesion error-prone DNA polymerase V autoproteolytic subunit [Haliea sp. AH-315-K21]|uniref:DNA polymerase V n=1 Tax=SAR86 cluster bacterium TaxID=2030880 RepID=A0A2A5CBN3_9GAMM|nr:translesion error-prone DNA polymerase V autoproteolytic subunit [Haliea sp. AH-315-K21]PCJ41183.1 MAG: DNA polymerase V [SAR86 cluster bacterium]
MQVTLLKPREALSYQPLPLYSSSVPAGFPSPADDYIEDSLDLNEYLIKHPSSTFFARASGLSMVNAGIMDNALLVVDRSIDPQHEDIVIAAVDGELTCKILDKQASVLRAANISFAPIPISEETDCIIQGVVTHVINKLCTRS